MHLRRALLLMALVLGVVALVEALAPVPRERRATEPPRSTAPQPPAAPVRTVRFAYPMGRKLVTARVPAGAHVLVQVRASAPGQAMLPGFGLVQPAEPATPATFDVLATRPGSYEVRFEPAQGLGAVLGRLDVGSDH
jgi:hypothetical protein